jgi:thiopurine S-methyltransferase
MEIDFWQLRWQNEETGFHQPEVNPYLAHYYGHLGPPPASRSKLRVFVPLCGKSMDMLWLSQNGYSVVGVEVSEIAVEAFFTENGLPLEKQVQGTHTRYSSGNIEIWQGDFFALTPEQLGDITDVYDRASLIALPPSMRKDYASKMLELLPAAARVLLVTLTYPQAEMDGPPFSVTEEEVRGLYEPHCSIEKLAVKNTLELEPRFKQKGLTSLYETAYKLKRNE